jgi:hypothetical protein
MARFPFPRANPVPRAALLADQPQQYKEVYTYEITQHGHPRSSCDDYIQVALSRCNQSALKERGRVSWV